MTALVLENLAALPFYARSLQLLLAHFVRALDGGRGAAPLYAVFLRRENGAQGRAALTQRNQCVIDWWDTQLSRRIIRFYRVVSHHQRTVPGALPSNGKRIFLSEKIQ
jgi:hypothetical protein